MRSSFASLGLLERVVLALEQRTGVEHRFVVEEELEEPVAEVVVGGDVAPRTSDAVGHGIGAHSRGPTVLRDGHATKSCRCV